MIEKKIIPAQAIIFNTADIMKNKRFMHVI